MSKPILGRKSKSVPFLVFYTKKRGWINMIISVDVFGILGFYLAIMCPWNISGKCLTWEYCSMQITQDRLGWSLGWTLDYDYIGIFLGPWRWEKDFRDKERWGRPIPEEWRDKV